MTLSVAENRRNWSRIIKEIKAGYLAAEGKALTDYKLGAAVGLDHSSIAHLERNSNAAPRHHTGERLLELHSRYSPHGTIPGNPPIPNSPLTFPS